MYGNNNKKKNLKVATKEQVTLKETVCGSSHLYLCLSVIAECVCVCQRCLVWVVWFVSTVRTWSSVATASHTRQKARSTSAYRREVRDRFGVCDIWHTELNTNIYCTVTPSFLQHRGRTQQFTSVVLNKVNKLKDVFWNSIALISSISAVLKQSR